MGHQAEIDDANAVKDVNTKDSTKTGDKLLTEIASVRNNGGQSNGADGDIAAFNRQLHEQGILPSLDIIDKTDHAGGSDDIQVHEKGDSTTERTYEATIDKDKNTLQYSHDDGTKISIDLASGKETWTPKNGAQFDVTRNADGSTESKTFMPTNGEGPKTYTFDDNGKITKISGTAKNGDPASAYTIDENNATTAGNGGIDLSTARVNPDGTLSYKNSSGQQVTEHLDGTTSVAPADTVDRPSETEDNNGGAEKSSKEGSTKEGPREQTQGEPPRNDEQPNGQSKSPPAR